MSGFGAVITSPLVLAGGAAIGLILILKKGSGGTSTQVSSGPSAAFLQSTTQQNSDALKAQVALAGINGNLGLAGIAAATTRDGYAFAYASNTARAAADLEAARVASNASVANSVITSNAAIVIDGQNNQTRLGLANVASRRDIALSHDQLAGVKYKAKMSLFSSIASAVSGVAAAVATGGMSTVAGSLGSIIGGAGNGAGAVSSSGASFAASDLATI